MYKTSRKAESAFSQRGKDIIRSRRANRIADQQRQLSIKQNELNMEQLYLIEDLTTSKVFTNPYEVTAVIAGQPGKWFMIGGIYFFSWMEGC